MSRFICLHVDVQLFQYHLLKRLSLLAKYVLLDFLLLMGEVLWASSTSCCGEGEGVEKEAKWSFRFYN